MRVSTKLPTEPLKCPRCESTNTKFCYYNNYNKSQPRHFCKGCKRHWTQGGLLHNVSSRGSRKNRDGNRVGQGRRCEESLTLTRRIFNPPCPAPTTSNITREKSSTSQIVVVQSKQNYDQNFPLVSNNIDEEKHTFNNFPSSSQPYDTIDNMFKGSIDTIPCSISTSTTSSNIYNYMENRDGNRTRRGGCGEILTLTHKFFNPSCPTPTKSDITREKNSKSQIDDDQNFPLVNNNIDEEKNVYDNFPSSSLPYDTIDNMFQGSIGTIPCSISTSTTSSNIYNYMENLDGTMEEESTITWQGSRTSSVMDNSSNYWNWDDIEALVSSDDFKNELGWN